MDAERVHTLCNALRDAFISREELEMMLAHRLDKSLDDIVGRESLKYVVFRLVRIAKSEGWLQELVDAALADKSHNHSLQAWVRTYGTISTSDPSPPTQQQMLDSMYFDLTDVRKAIRRAKAAASSGIIGLGVTYSELVFVNKLCDWIANCLTGETQRKDPLNLRPELAPVSRRLHQIARYRRDLESTNVLCVVFVDGVPHEYIAEFWTAACRDFKSLEYYFVLVFTGDRHTVFPSGIAVLPPPRFDLDDVALWAEEMIVRRGWPINLANAWTELLCDEALEDKELDVRALYEAMDHSIEEIRFAPDAFRRRLEGMIRRGNAASG